MSDTRRRFWELYALVYDAVWQSPLVDATKDVLLRHVAGTGTAVDLGCGTGLFSEPLTRRGWRTIGVDSSPVMLKRAREQKRCSELVLADVVDTGLSSGLVPVPAVGGVRSWVKMVVRAPEPRPVFLWSFKAVD